MSGRFGFGPELIPKDLDELIESFNEPFGQAEARAYTLLEDLKRLARTTREPTLRTAAESIRRAYLYLQQGKTAEALTECKRTRALWPATEGGREKTAEGEA